MLMGKKALNRILTVTDKYDELYIVGGPNGRIVASSSYRCIFL